MPKVNKPMKRYEFSLTAEEADRMERFINMGELTGPKLKYHLIHGREFIKKHIGIEKMPVIVNYQTKRG